MNFVHLLPKVVIDFLIFLFHICSLYSLRFLIANLFQSLRLKLSDRLLFWIQSLLSKSLCRRLALRLVTFRLLPTLDVVAQVLRFCLLFGCEISFLRVLFVFHPNIVSLDLLIFLDSVSLEEYLIIGQFVIVAAQVAVISNRNFGIVKLL